MRNVTINFTDSDKALMEKYQILATENEKLYKKKWTVSKHLTNILCVLGIAIAFFLRQYDFGYLFAVACFLMAFLSLVGMLIYDDKWSFYAWRSNVTYNVILRNIRDIRSCSDRIQYNINMEDNTVEYMDSNKTISPVSGILFCTNNIPKTGDIVLNVKEYKIGKKITHGWFAETEKKCELLSN